MTSPTTTSFNPSLGNLTLYAFQLCGVRPTALTAEHMQSANMAANMVLADFSVRGPNLWKISLVTTPLVQGQATYSVDPAVVNMLDTYISTTVGSVETDRLILPISRSEYASLANKQTQGFPVSYWNDRLLSPSVSLWPVPDGTQTALKYYALTQIYDARLSGAQTVDIPYLWLKAYAYALACELAVIWAPDRLAVLQPISGQAYAAAADQNVETSQFYLSPTTSGYFRA